MNERRVRRAINEWWRDEKYQEIGINRGFETSAEVLTVWITSFWVHGFNILEYLAITLNYTDLLFTQSDIENAIILSEKYLEMRHGSLLEDWKQILCTINRKEDLAKNIIGHPKDSRLKKMQLLRKQLEEHKITRRFYNKEIDKIEGELY